MLTTPARRLFFVFLVFLLVTQLSFAATLVTSVPIAAVCNDPQGGTGITNCTSKVNVSDDTRASINFDTNHPAWINTNWTVSLPADAVVTNASLTFEHQQSAINLIRVNVSIKTNGSSNFTKVCSISPLTVKNRDVRSVCDITGYINNSVDASFIQIAFNMTQPGGKQFEKVDFIQLNLTYIDAAALTGNITLTNPSNESVFSPFSAFDLNSTYALSCNGSFGQTCGVVEIFGEYCKGDGCTNFTRITSATDVSNLSANSKSCGEMGPGGNCISSFGVSLSAAPGTYQLRTKARSINNTIISSPVTTIFVPTSIPTIKPPTVAVCNDPQGGGGVFTCTSQVNVSDNTRAEMQFDNNHPTWAIANWTFNISSNAIIESVIFTLEHQQSAANVISVNVSVKQNGSSAFTKLCDLFPLTSANVDTNNSCNMTQFISDSANASLIQFIFNMSNTGGKQWERMDYMRINLTYRTPYLSTDDNYYSDGDTVLINGIAFPYNSNISVNITGPSGLVSGYPKYTITNGSGNFNDSFVTETDANGTYSITVVYVNDSLIRVQRNVTVAPTGPRVTFVPPTPDTFTLLSQNWVYINTTMSKNASAALLEWAGVNYTMSGSGKNWYINMTGLASDDYTYSVWANSTTNGAWRASESRVVSIDVSPPTVSDLNAVLNDSELYSPVTISSTVLDDTGVSSVIYEITYPNGTAVNVTASNNDNLFYYTGDTMETNNRLFGNSMRRVDFNVSLYADKYSTCGYVEKFANTNQSLYSWICNSYSSGDPRTNSNCSLIGNLSYSSVPVGADWRCFNISELAVVSNNVSIVWGCPSCPSTQPVVQNISYLDGTFDGNLSMYNSQYYRTTFNLSDSSAASFSVTTHLERVGNLGAGAKLNVWILNASQLATWTAATAPKCQFAANKISATAYQTISCSDASAHSGIGNYTVILGMIKTKANTYLSMQTDTPAAGMSEYNTTATTWNISSVDYDLTLTYTISSESDWALHSSNPLNPNATHTYNSSNAGLNWSVAKSLTNETIEDYVSIYQRINNFNYTYTFLDTDLEGDYTVRTYANDTLGNLNATQTTQFHIYHPTTLVLSDQTDNASRFINDSIIFYANYSSAAVGGPVTGASCNISFNTSGNWTVPAAMTYNGTSKMYEYAQSFTVSGTYGFSVYCAKTHYQTQNVTSNFTIRSRNEYLITDRTTVSTCNVVYYKVSVYDVSNQPIDADIDIKTTDPSSILQSETNTTTGNGGIGVYLGSYTLQTAAQLGNWLIEAIALTIKGTKTFLVGTGAGGVWKIDIAFAPDQIVYSVGTNISMNFTPYNFAGERITGLLPSNITVQLDSTNVTSSTVEINGTYQYNYTAVIGSHAAKATVGNVTNTRSFVVQ